MFVDTAPVMEKPLAAAAGLGWQGKHTNLVSREFGSWLFLGSIFTTLDLPPDAPEERPLRKLPRLSRRLPDRRARRALPDRRAAVHLLSDHRGQGPDPARFARKDRQSHLWLRRLPRRLPMEQVRARRARGEIAGPRRSALPRRSPNWRRWTRRRSAQNSPAGRSSASALRVSCAMCWSPSAIPAMSRWRRWRRRVSGMSSGLVRGMAVWALARLLSREKFLTLAAARRGNGNRSSGPRRMGLGAVPVNLLVFGLGFTAGILRKPCRGAFRHA